MIGDRDAQLKRAGRALEARDKALVDAQAALTALKLQQDHHTHLQQKLAASNSLEGTARSRYRRM